MAKKEKIVQEDKGALAVINEANQQMKPKKQVASLVMNDGEFDANGVYVDRVVVIDDIIGYSGAENWFVIQRKDGVTVFNRTEIRFVEINYKDVE